MRKLIVWLGVAFVGGWCALALAGDWEDDVLWMERSIEINGRTVQEIAFSGEPGGAEIVVLVLTNGPVNGTSMLAKTIALEELFFGDEIDFDEIGDGQFFSIGEGCHLGGADVFVYIRDFKPQRLRVRDGGYVVTDFVVNPTDQYTGAACTLSSDGSRIHYLLQNRTQSRLEFFLEFPLDTIVDKNAGIINVGDVFAGFSRYALGTGPGNDLAVFYQRNDGLMRDVVVDGSTYTVRQICAGFHEMPVPTAFVLPREVTLLAMPLQAGVFNYRFGGISDFNRDGVIDLALSNASGACGQATTSYGSAGSAAPYGWADYVAIAEPSAQWSWVGNGASFGVFVHATGQNEPMTPPPVRAGGPTAGMAMQDNDTQRPGGLLGASSLIDPAAVTFAYSADVPQELSNGHIFGSRFERAGPASIATRAR